MKTHQVNTVCEVLASMPLVFRDVIKMDDSCLFFLYRQQQISMQEGYFSPILKMLLKSSKHQTFWKHLHANSLHLARAIFFARLFFYFISYSASSSSSLSFSLMALSLCGGLKFQLNLSGSDISRIISCLTSRRSHTKRSDSWVE